MIRDRWNSTTSRLALAAVCAAGLVAAPLGFNGASIASNSAAAQSDEGGGVSADIGADLGGVGADIGADVDAGGGGVSADAGAGVDAGDGGASADDGADADAGGSGASADDGADADGGGGSADVDAGGGGASADVGADVDTGGGGAGANAGAGGAETEGAAPQADIGGGTVVDDAPHMETAAGRSPSVGRSGHPGVSAEEMPYRYFVSLNTGTPAFQQYKAAAERDDLEAAGDALSAATDRPVTLDLVDYVNAQLDVRTALTARQIAAAANDLPLAAGGLRRGAPGGVTDAAAEDIIGDAVQR